jgi:phosphomannomutase
MSVFKAYDIRGLYPSQLNEKLARAVGYHFARLLTAEGPVVVGRDMRSSSPLLAEATMDGIMTAGRDVIDLGMATTPMVYFATARRDAAGGIAITASHNPAGWNGMKFCREEAIPVGSASGLGDVQALVEAEAPIEEAGERGARANDDIVAEMAAFIAEVAGELPPVKVAIDTGNGTAGPFVDRMAAGLPLDIVPLFFEPDGTFPNHEANPLKLENLRDLQAAVKEHGCALGLAFDGDGDRVALVDDEGKPVGGDALTALVARQELAAGPQTILYDLRSSRCVREEVERLGGRAIETRVGHAFIKAAMREHDAAFAGELSGHFYFRAVSFAESPWLAVVRVLQLMAAEGKPLSALHAEVERYPRTGELNFHVDDKDGAIERLAERFGDAAQSRLDGITLRYASWWCNVRKSNTEPLLRLNLEADDEATLAEAKARVVDAIGGEPE